MTPLSPPEVFQGRLLALFDALIEEGPLVAALADEVARLTRENTRLRSGVTVERFADDIGAAFDTIPGCEYPDTDNDTIDCWKELAERLAMEYDFIRKPR